MKHLLSFFFIGSLILSVNAQQLQTSSLFEIQSLLHNPSTAGLQKNIAGISYRSTFTGVGGNPKTAIAFASFDMPKNKIGVGGYLYNDVTGPTSRTGIQLAFAKHIPINEKSSFSLGIETRFQQFAVNRDKISQALGSSDPVLAGLGNKFKFDAGFGIVYHSDKVELGASVAQLIQPKLDIYSGNLSRSEEARLYRHFYFHGHYNWAVDADAKIIPHFLLIYLPNAPVEFQGGVRVEHHELFWWGLAFRSKQSLNFSAGLNITKKFSMGYAFDLYRTPWSVFDAKGASGNELMLRYNFVK